MCLERNNQDNMSETGYSGKLTVNRARFMTDDLSPRIIKIDSPSFNRRIKVSKYNKLNEKAEESTIENEPHAHKSNTKNIKWKKTRGLLQDFISNDKIKTEKLLRSKTSRKTWRQKHTARIQKGISTGVSIINQNISTVLLNNDINPDQQKNIDSKMMKYFIICFII